MNAGAQSARRAKHRGARGGRREFNVTSAEKALAQGDSAMTSKNYDVAVVAYKSACDNLPEAPATHESA